MDRSFGGHYGPATAAVIVRQNQKITSGSLARYKYINLDSLGLVAACIDTLVEGSSEAQFALNNTYGKQFITEAEYERNKRQWPQCAAAIKRCQQTSLSLDPEPKGDNAQVNSVCYSAFSACSTAKSAGVGDRSVYDIAAPEKVKYSMFAG
jgi:carboxypeptidase C (cathepsin A)